VTFRFVGTFKEAFKVYLGLIVLMFPTLGLIFPYARFRQRAYIVAGHRFGGAAFEFSARAREFYRIYLKAALLSLAVGVLTVLVVGGASALLSQIPGMPRQTLYVVAGTAATYGTAFMVWTYTTARITNLAYNHSKLGPHRFRSTVRARDMLAIYATNALAIVLSLGMLMPWAQVRLARYRADHFTLCAHGDLSEFAAEASAERGAFGEEAANLFDMDLSL